MDASRDETPAAEVTRLLSGLARGEGAQPDAIVLVYGEMRRLADACFRSQPESHTLQPTALVHEAFARLFGAERVSFDGRRQFFALAARAMRQILVDHARTKRRDKRGGGAHRVALDDALATARSFDTDLIDLDAALADLAALDPDQAKLVELRFFGGLEMQEVATLLDVSLATAEREWRSARAWLGRRLAQE